MDFLNFIFLKKVLDSVVTTQFTLNSTTDYILKNSDIWLGGIDIKVGVSLYKNLMFKT